MSGEIGEHALSVPGYVLAGRLKDGPNTIIIPIGRHKLKATAETR